MSLVRGLVRMFFSLRIGKAGTGTLSGFSYAAPSLRLSRQQSNSSRL
jgi:hypothetical protein